MPEDKRKHYFEAICKGCDELGITCHLRCDKFKKYREGEQHGTGKRKGNRKTSKKRG